MAAGEKRGSFSSAEKGKRGKTPYRRAYFWGETFAFSLEEEERKKDSAIGTNGD